MGASKVDLMIDSSLSLAFFQPLAYYLWRFTNRIYSCRPTYTPQQPGEEVNMQEVDMHVVDMQGQPGSRKGRAYFKRTGP